MPNITDVAKLAGVSVATVSRFIRSPEKVAKKSALRVSEAITALNYSPNLLARNFSESRSYTVMVLVPDLRNPFLADVIHGIEKVGKDLGYQFLLTEIAPSEPNFDEYFQKPESKYVDGVIQLFSTLPTSYDATQSSKPVVVLSDCSDDEPCTSVTIDDEEAAEAMVNHLISLGHRRIASIQGPDFVKASAKRQLGYHRALASAGITEEIILGGLYSLQSGYDVAKEFCELDPRPTAAFCHSDVIAMGFIKGLQRFGMSVPKDISVTGFDDIAFSEYFSPSLTTIGQPAVDLGAKAMETLVGLIKNSEKHNEAPKLVTLPWELKIRESTAPPSI